MEEETGPSKKRTAKRAKRSDTQLAANSERASAAAGGAEEYMLEYELEFLRYEHCPEC
jgi:hypothetical protein